MSTLNCCFCYQPSAFSYQEETLHRRLLRVSTSSLVFQWFKIFYIQLTHFSNIVLTDSNNSIFFIFEIF